MWLDSYSIKRKGIQIIQKISYLTRRFAGDRRRRKKNRFSSKAIFCPKGSRLIFYFYHGIKKDKRTISGRRRRRKRSQASRFVREVYSLLSCLQNFAHRTNEFRNTFFLPLFPFVTVRVNIYTIKTILSKV